MKKYENTHESIAAQEDKPFTNAQSNYLASLYSELLESYITPKSEMASQNDLKSFKTSLPRQIQIFHRISNEILRLAKKNLINSAAHITGGGLIENLLRSIPSNLSLNIDLSKIKTTKIFKWLKSKNISDKEMIRTFNCGVGFCLIVPKKNILKIKKIFS